MRTLAIGEEVRARVVKWFGERPKPYGFLHVEGVERDVFCSHARVLRLGFLKVGDIVSAEIRMDRDGRLFADNVDLLDGSGR